MSVTTSEDRAAIDAELERVGGGQMMNGNRSLEEIAAAEENEQMQLLDLGNQITATSKGRKPTTSQIKVKSVSVPVAGQMERGEIRTILLTVRCVSVGFHDKDESDTDRRHTLEPVGTPHLLSKEQADLALGVSEG